MHNCVHMAAATVLTLKVPDWHHVSILMDTLCGHRAVTEAKNEVMERKRDLDTTKEKMDKLVEKLYLGRSVTVPRQIEEVSFAALCCMRIGC